MGLKAIFGRPAGDHEVIKGPGNERVNASTDKARGN